MICKEEFHCTKADLSAPPPPVKGAEIRKFRSTHTRHDDMEGSCVQTTNFLLQRSSSTMYQVVGNRAGVESTQSKSESLVSESESDSLGRSPCPRVPV